ncbi:DUF5994 family protein [Streptomyces avermitilis]|uniref:DUF5994 family protein n=1 Tax=Streptomyces avermitilis TaxID=33903 RepID=UPI0036866BAB
MSRCSPAPRCCGWRRHPSARGRSTFDGAWRPRSRDLASQLTGLLTALTAESMALRTSGWALTIGSLST